MITGCWDIAKKILYIVAQTVFGQGHFSYLFFVWLFACMFCSSQQCPHHILTTRSVNSLRVSCHFWVCASGCFHSMLAKYPPEEILNRKACHLFQCFCRGHPWMLLVPLWIMLFFMTVFQTQQLFCSITHRYREPLINQDQESCWSH